MKPPIDKACYHHGVHPYPAVGVEDITAQTGDGTGFREIHQAWLLPESDIAIYEQRQTGYNDAVVESMQVLR